MTIDIRRGLRLLLVGLGVVLASLLFVGCASNTPEGKSASPTTVGAVEAGRPVVMKSSVRNRRGGSGYANPGMPSGPR